MKKTLIALSLCLLLSGCAGKALPVEKDLTPTGLEEFLEITNARRRSVVKPAPDTSLVENWDTGEVPQPAGIDRVEFSFNPDISENEVYTPEQVREDLDILFYYYEVGYGPYFYFGGKEAFDAAKAAVWADMEKLNEITASDLEESLVRHLEFVQDAHFRINHRTAVPRLEGYLSEEVFRRDAAGFTDADGNRLSSVAGNREFAGNMVLSLSSEGDVAYRYMLLSEQKPQALGFEFESGKTVYTEFFSSHAAAGEPQASEENVTLTYIDDIPVIKADFMGFPHAKDDGSANKFLELAEQLKDAPVLIVDLRANGGGNGLIAQMFYEKLTGAYTTPNHYSLTRLVYGPQEYEPDPDSFYYIPNEVLRRFTKPEAINDSWKLENPEPREVIEREPFLIVLTSKGTASSADNFTDIAFNIENSLVIGSNTAGVMVSSASVGVKLPNTGIIGQMGFNFSVYDPEHFREGVGFMPDIWTSGDALEAAVALVNKSSS